MLVYFSNGEYVWFEFLVQKIRTSDYQFGGFNWKHEPDPSCFRMKLWFVDNYFQIRDTSYFYCVDRWGGSNRMMPCSHAILQQYDV